MTTRIMVRLGGLVTVLAVMGMLLAGCGSATGTSASGGSTPLPTSRLTEEQATKMANETLDAFNKGDFAGYSRYWDSAMKAAIKDGDFQSFRDTIVKGAGKFVSVAGAELVHAKTAGYVKWIFACTFEKSQMYYALTFKQDGDQVVGAYLDAAKP